MPGAMCGYAGVYHFIKRRSVLTMYPRGLVLCRTPSTSSGGS